MKIFLYFLVFLCIVATSFAVKDGAEKLAEKEGVKVEVDQGKDPKATTNNNKQPDNEEEQALDDEQDDEAEEEEEDPNAKIDVEELYVPKGCNNTTKAGDQVVVHYTGWLSDGSLFDTTIDHRKGYQPFEFILGSGAVIKGFEKALIGMCKGQRRKVIIPPALAYGKKGTTDIPGKKTSCQSIKAQIALLLDF